MPPGSKPPTWAPARRLPAEQIRGQQPRPVRREPGNAVRRRRPRPGGPGGRRRHLGLRRRVELSPDAAARAARRCGGPGGRGHEHRSDRAGRRAGPRRRHLGVELRGRPVHRERRPTRSRCSTTGARRLLAATASITSTRRCCRSRSADVLRRRRHHRDPAAGPAAPVAWTRSPSRPAARFETMRTLAPPIGRGWEYLAGDRLGLGRRAGSAARSCWPRSWPRPSSSRAATTW